MIIDSLSKNLNELGLHEEALQTAEQELQIRQDKFILSQAVKIALTNKCYNLAADYADLLKASPGLEKRHFELIGLAYNFAGRSADAYSCCREQMTLNNPGDTRDYYTLACRAGSIGSQEEAFESILIALSGLSEGDSYLARKAFLDSELDGAWNQAQKSTPTLAMAINLRFSNLREIVEDNIPVEPERCVDHSDLAFIPAEFQAILKPQCASTWSTTPLTVAENPDLYRRYLAWQDETVKPRLEAFKRYMETAFNLLEDYQERFAHFQAAKHRFGAARVHLLRALKKLPDADPRALSEIPLLAPLLSEFRKQFQESPETFASLISHQHHGLTLEEFNALPDVNRRSGTAALLLGNGYYDDQNYEEAIQSWTLCSKIWPWDETPLLNMVMALVQTGRQHHAAQALEAIRPKAISDHLRRKIECNILNEEWAGDTFGHCEEIPTPEFRGFYPGANEEFLKLEEKAQKISHETQP